jgi:hypothetical protein
MSRHSDPILVEAALNYGDSYLNFIDVVKDTEHILYARLKEHVPRRVVKAEEC